MVIPYEVIHERECSVIRATMCADLLYRSLWPCRHCRRADGDIAPAKKRVAAIVTEYRHNSHADVIVSRLLQTDTLDGQGRESPLELVSLYTDQRPANDISRLLAASHRFRTSDTIEDALTLGTGQLAVDGVLLVAEHGQYPKVDNRQHAISKATLSGTRRSVCFARAAGRAGLYRQASGRQLGRCQSDLRHRPRAADPVDGRFVAAGSWRKPPADVARGAALPKSSRSPTARPTPMLFTPWSSRRRWPNNAAAAKPASRRYVHSQAMRSGRHSRQTSSILELFDAAWSIFPIRESHAQVVARRRARAQIVHVRIQRRTESPSIWN